MNAFDGSCPAGLLSKGPGGLANTDGDDPADGPLATQGVRGETVGGGPEGAPARVSLGGDEGDRAFNAAIIIATPTADLGKVTIGSCRPLVFIVVAAQLGTSLVPCGV